MDAHLEARVRPRTILTYKRAALPFCQWVLAHFFALETSEHWDDAIMLYKQDPEVNLTKNQFSVLMTAVQFYFPRFRGQLHLCRAAADGWSLLEPVHHTVPLGQTPSKLLACHWAARSMQRLGLAAVLQSHTGLRPSELLGLLPEHVLFPSDTGGDPLTAPVLLALGVKQGTKVKRPQVAKIPADLKELISLLWLCRQHTAPGHRLFPFSLSTWRTELRSLDELLGFRAGWTPHSGRSGFATDSRIAGKSFEEVREAGRWQADASLRTYLDIAAAATVLVQSRLAGRSSALAWADQFWHQYFVSWNW